MVVGLHEVPKVIIQAHKWMNVNYASMKLFWVLVFKAAREIEGKPAWV